jgi:carbon monoxide dehydrogenase subunit G
VIEFETNIHIHRPIEEVFAYVSEPLNFRRWNSAVQSVRKTSGREGDVGSTYSMERQLPTGRAVNELEIVARERSREFTIRTTSGPALFGYRYRFSGENGATVVQVGAAAELGGAADFLAPIVRRAVKKGVDDNLATLKTILETHGN